MNKTIVRMSVDKRLELIAKAIRGEVKIQLLYCGRWLNLSWDKKYKDFVTENLLSTYTVIISELVSKEIRVAL